MASSLAYNSLPINPIHNSPLSTMQSSIDDDINVLKLALLCLQGIPISVPVLSSSFSGSSSPPFTVAASKGIHHPLWEVFIEVGNIFTYINKFLANNVPITESIGINTTSTTVALTHQSSPSTVTSSSNRQFSTALYQALYAGVRNELDTYLRDLANIEIEISRSTSSGTVGKGLTTSTSTGWSLRRLYVWTVPSVQRLRILHSILNHVKGLTGSNILNSIYQDSLQMGDKESRKIYLRLLNYMLQPFEKYCFQWLYCLLDDTIFIPPPNNFSTNNPLLITNETDYSFFFITQNMGSNLYNDLWLKYGIHYSLIPLFLSTEICTNLYTCGKTLRFIRDACHDEDWVTELANTISTFPGLGKRYSSSSSVTVKDTFPSNPTTGSSPSGSEILPYEEFVNTLQRNVQLIGPIIDMRLLWLLREHYQLLSHFAAIHRYILLTQGDFAANLVATLAVELRKPASVINANNRHIMESLLESAVRASNAQLDDRSVLDRVTIRTSIPSTGTTKGTNALQGWDIIYLEYSIDEPINSIVNIHAHKVLTESFKFLWKIRRCEYELNLAWSEQARLVHDLRKDAIHFVDDIEDTQAPLALLHRGQLLRADIMSFLSTLLAYVMYDVLAPAWTTLHTGVMNAKNMDILIRTYHYEYLHSIATGLFLPTTLPSVPNPNHHIPSNDELSISSVSYSSDSALPSYTEALKTLRETLLTILVQVQQYVDLQRKYCTDLARTLNQLEDEQKKQRGEQRILSVNPSSSTQSHVDGGRLLAEICMKHAPALDSVNEQYRSSIHYLVQLTEHLPSKLADKVSSLLNRYDFHGVVRNI